MYGCLYPCFKDCDICCFVQVSRVVHAHAFVHVFTRALRTVTLVVLFKCLESSIRLYMSLHVLKDCDTCCFVQVSRVVHAHAFVHVFTRA